MQEALLVIDATAGQNGLNQAREFASAAGVTGVVLTKLDGTAKGGIALTIEDDARHPDQANRGGRGDRGPRAVRPEGVRRRHPLVGRVRARQQAARRRAQAAPDAARGRCFRLHRLQTHRADETS